MKIEQRYHVIALTPREQVALRGLLFNAFSGWIDKTIKESVGRTEEELTDKSAYTYRLFCRYNDIIDYLANDENLAKAKPVCLTLTNETIKLMVIAVRGFDEKANFLGPVKIESVKAYYAAVKDKVLESANHTYTKREIDIAKRMA